MGLVMTRARESAAMETLDCLPVTHDHNNQAEMACLLYTKMRPDLKRDCSSQ